ncbi:MULTISPECIES: GAK system XXXCH domain-containing protein [unclassified Pseudodesulfovibrio]|uniref:GAK system XXXCH domain-containing protein n=1 Tax=unclassified Pseudodesulfovibrio TaxID=2661612 RepID=UPI000FEBDF3A|nr:MULTISPECIES: GAK system XXXCH domain-containing protein [unclassified Pseudodesulfovibrio]MCJ2164403.1 GAK system XXXCH domain-containing protein [Pseudodesulfovibrio sp. S3-i]RWU04609.1 GAK system XXXCH domain-containing protein [Pseudodesulfovibrio sp. S3]
MNDDNKLNRYVDQKELADFFRTLADAIEKGGQDEFACIDNFKKIKIRVKNEFGQINLKARVKSAKPCEVSEDETVQAVDGKPKYSALKKRMKSSFRVLIKMIHDGIVPPKEAVESFLADSALMVTYAGFGDEYYESYTLACAALREAFDSGDIEKMHASVDVLIHEKSRCHAKFD